MTHSRSVTRDTAIQATRTSPFIPVLIILGLLWCFSPLSAQQCHEGWRWLNPLPQGNAYLSVAYGAGTYVATAVFGTILTSPDAKTWTERESGTYNDLDDVIWTGSQFIASGMNGTIASSPDGVRWTLVDTGLEDELFGIAYGNGTYVAVGCCSNQCVVSQDGLHWEVVSLPSITPVWEITFGAGLFVAVGGRGLIETSPDGRTWTYRESPTVWDFEDVIWTGSKFIAVGINGVIAASSDGVRWTEVNYDEEFNLYGVAASPRQVVAVGWLYGYGVGLLSSKKGIGWERHFNPSMALMRKVIWSGSQFVAVGFSDILTSPDGLKWTSQASGYIPGYLLSGVATDGQGYVASGYLTNGILFHSPNTWGWERARAPSSSYLNGVAWGNGYWVAAGYSGALLASPNGVDWTAIETSYGFPYFEGVSFLNNRFYVLFGGGFLSSSDATNWDYTRTPGRAIQNMAFGNGRYAAIAYDSPLLWSDDSLEWHESNSQPFNALTGIAFGGGRFVAVGPYDLILTSTNGVDWTRSYTGYDYMCFFDVAYGDGLFVAVGSYGQAFASRNGTDWYILASPRSVNPLMGVTFDGSEFIAASNLGNTAVLSTCLHFSASGRSQNAEGKLYTALFTGKAFSGTPPYFYEWDFGDGSPPMQGESVEHTYAGPGMRQGLMTARDSGSPPEQKSVFVTFLSPPYITKVKPGAKRGEIVVKGTNLQPALKIYVNGWEYGDFLIKKNGKVSIFNIFPDVGKFVIMRISNPDGGSVEFSWPP
jgi:hypothetical protein